MLPEHRAKWLKSRGLDVEMWGQEVREPTGDFENLEFAFEGNISNDEKIHAFHARHYGGSVELTLHIGGNGNKKTVTLSAQQTPSYDGMPIICALSCTLSAKPPHQNTDITIVDHSENIHTTTTVMIDGTGAWKQSPIFLRSFQAPQWLEKTTVMTLKFKAKF